MGINKARKEQRRVRRQVQIERGHGGDCPWGGAGARRSRHRSLESRRRQMAAALESLAGNYLGLSGDRLRALLTSLKRRRGKPSSVPPPARGTQLSQGGELQESEVCPHSSERQTPTLELSRPAARPLQILIFYFSLWSCIFENNTKIKIEKTTLEKEGLFGSCHCWFSIKYEPSPPTATSDQHE